MGTMRRPLFSVRVSLVILPIFALAMLGRGQSLPVVSIAAQPFSADEVIVQDPKPNVHNVLAMKTIRIYRDSAGRTREDVSIPRDPTAAQLVNIDDPIGGVHYYLDDDAKTARRLVYPKPTPSGVGPTGTPPSSPEKIVTFLRNHDVRTTSESLGRRLIEGLAVDGRRVTSVSPESIPGCAENVSVIESWYSAELQMTVLQKWSNCLGSGTIRMEHIKREEPDLSLFQPPSNYTIIE